MGTPEDLRRQVRAVAVRGLPLDQLWGHLDAVLRRAVPWDVAAWGTVDPATLLSTSCAVTGAPYDPERELRVFALEHDDREPGRLLDLARRTPPVACLRDSTGGRPETAPRWGLLLEPLGLHDDLRLAFVQAGTCWGSLYAYRRDRSFPRNEAALLGGLSELLAEAVRLCLLRDAAASGEEEAPGLLLLDGEGQASAASAAGERWLQLLGGAPAVVHSLAASLNAAEPGPSSARVQTLDGRWAVVHASTVSGSGAALIVEAARPVVVAELLAAAYAFTPRERDVVGLVLRGDGNRQVARTLGISEHTVKEHVKALFTKTGVTNRGELAAVLLREQYLPRRGVLAPSPQGFFLASA